MLTIHQLGRQLASHIGDHKWHESSPGNKYNIDSIFKDLSYKTTCSSFIRIFKLRLSSTSLTQALIAHLKEIIMAITQCPKKYLLLFTMSTEIFHISVDTKKWQACLGSNNLDVEKFGFPTCNIFTLNPYYFSETLFVNFQNIKPFWYLKAINSFFVVNKS